MSDDMGYLCLCGNLEESGFHCADCGRQPPWGCDCADCQETEADVCDR